MILFELIFRASSTNAINFYSGFMSCFHQNIYLNKVSDCLDQTDGSLKFELSWPMIFILDEVDVIEVLEGAVRYVNTMESQLRNSSTQR